MNKKRLLKARGLSQMGQMETTEGNYASGLKYFQEALALYQQEKQELEIARSYNNIGTIFFYQNDLDQAEIYFHKSLEMYEVLPPISSKGMPLGNLGNVYDMQCNNALAQKYYQLAIELHQSFGNLFGESIYQANLGDSFISSGLHQKGIVHLKKALDLARAFGAKKQEAITLEHLARAHQSLNNPELARSYYREAFLIYQESDLEFERDFCLGNLATLQLREQLFEEAERGLRQSISGCASYNSSAADFFSLNLALLLAQKGQVQEAEQYYRPIPADLFGMPLHLIEFLCVQAQVKASLNADKEARGLFAQAQDILLQKESLKANYLANLCLQQTQEYLETFKS